MRRTVAAPNSADIRLTRRGAEDPGLRRVGACSTAHHDIHEDAMLSVQEVDPKKMDHVIDIFRTVRKELGIEMPKDGQNVRLTQTQVRAIHGIERVNTQLA
jgi:hypothetical protein